MASRRTTLALAGAMACLLAGGAKAQECSANDPTRFSIHSHCQDDAPRLGAASGWHPSNRQMQEGIRACAKVPGSFNATWDQYGRFYCMMRTPRYQFVPVD
jgi:hypothetical protein